MSEERSDFRKSHQEGARSAAGEAGDGAHPGLDRLAAYHEGELPEAEAERVREHLSRCRECADLLLDWRDFARDEPSGAASAAAAAWERDRDRVREGVARRVGAERGVDGGRSESPEGDAAYAGLRRGRRAPWLVAAAALAAATVSGVLLWQERVENRRPRQVELASVLPEGSSVLRGREEEAEVLTGGGSRPVVLLHLGEPEEYPRYQARIVPPAGEGAAFVLELSPVPSGPFTVQLGRDPEPGEYRVVLSGVRDGERREVATYRFRVRTP